MALQDDLLNRLSKEGELPKAEQRELGALTYKAKYQQTTPAASTTSDVATSDAIQNGADPLALALAKKQLGEKQYIGYCESFVEGVTGSGWRGASATDAWNRQASAGKTVDGLNGVQPGDAVYFSDPNQPYGHTGVYAGNNQFISATDNGIQQNDINNWVGATGQKVLGYVPKGE